MAFRGLRAYIAPVLRFHENALTVVETGLEVTRFCSPCRVERISEGDTEEREIELVETQREGERTGENVTRCRAFKTICQSPPSLAVRFVRQQERCSDSASVIVFNGMQDGTVLKGNVRSNALDLGFPANSKLTYVEVAVYFLAKQSFSYCRLRFGM